MFPDLMFWIGTKCRPNLMDVRMYQYCTRLNLVVLILSFRERNSLVLLFSFNLLKEI